ncbi:ATP:cob(I)alamin adenosyltransferase, partial [Vibrio parahaemolyticus]|nr:ATP:cob(I)alamin adenosyltransferase [Vibrio parahaemolyticus]MDF4856611.1 ATP:cob(I)alamin adenosyltransferase [Vibrio parahaemolyticus]
YINHVYQVEETEFVSRSYAMPKK